jgi:hypothetical protein
VLVCTETCCDIYRCTYNILRYIVRFTPSIILPYSSLPLLRTISTDFILLFSYLNTKHMQNNHPHSSFLMLTPVLLVPTPRKDLFYPPVLHFLKVYVDSSGEFHLGTSGLYTTCFNQMYTPISYSFSITMLP